MGRILVLQNALRERLKTLLRMKKPPARTAKIIAAAPLHVDPTPYFFAKDVLPVDMFRQIIANWPAPDYMVAEGTPGVFIKELVSNHQYKTHIRDESGVQGISKEIEPFWSYFVQVVVPELIRGTAARYGNFVRARYGALPVTLEVASLMLMEVRQGYSGHNVHVHHHTPQWFSTNLLYVDDYGTESRGTTLYAFEALDDTPEAALRTKMGAMKEYEKHLDINVKYADHFGLTPNYRAPFEPNGMFSFFETVYAFHSGPTMGEGRTDQARKVVRMHLRHKAGTPIRGYVYDAPEGAPVARDNAEWILNDLRMVAHAQELERTEDELKGAPQTIYVPPLTPWQPEVAQEGWSMKDVAAAG